MTPINPVFTRIEDALVNISNKVDLHIAMDEERGKKTDKMYETLITGNGNPSVLERVRNLETSVIAYRDPIAEIASIKTRIEKIEDWVKTERAIAGTVFLLIGSDLVLRIWALVTK